MLKMKLFVFLIQLWTLTLSTNVSSCVDNYLDFEEQTFGNNSENRMKLYQAFYPPNDHLPYSVAVSYQAVLPNGTRVNISTDPSCTDRQVWLWLSSPFLLNIHPTNLNRLALYTLNHFTEWVPPHLTIATPLPCSAIAEEFLTLMTTSLQAYALGEMSNGKYLEYSLQGCTRGVVIFYLREGNLVLHSYGFFGVVSFIFVWLFGSMASVLLLQAPLKSLSQTIDSYSLDSYGMFWGLSAILCPFVALLLYIDIRYLSESTFNPGNQQTSYVRYIWPFVLAFPMIFSAPVAIYVGVKYNLPTPSVYVLPAKLLCCCSEKRARALILSLTVWLGLVAANFIVGHGLFVLKAFPVAPFAVTVNVMLLVLSVMCLTYIMALVFTICASVGSRRCLSSRADCVATVRAAMLIPLLLAVIFFSFKDAFHSQLVNTATQQNSLHVLLKALFTPVLLAAMSLYLKRFISVWMHWSPGGEKDGCALSSVRGNWRNEYEALDDVAVE